jgi:outer membrane lipopolysaccharide assembly protein LptE/RlpB
MIFAKRTAKIICFPAYVPAFLLSIIIFLFIGCGYRLMGTGGALPPGVRVLAVPPFERQVAVLQLDQRVTEQVRQELIRRTKVRVQAAKEGADAVLYGVLTNYSVVPISYDQQGRANRFQVSMAAKLRLADASGKNIYESEGYRFTQNYERSASPQTYINEEKVAYDVVARDFARNLVGRLLEADLTAPAPQAPPPQPSGSAAP